MSPHVDTASARKWRIGQPRVCDDIAVTAELIDLARAGDGEAFRQLVGPYQRELPPAAGVSAGGTLLVSRTPGR